MNHLLLLPITADSMQITYLPSVVAAGMRLLPHRRQLEVGSLHQHHRRLQQPLRCTSKYSPHSSIDFVFQNRPFLCAVAAVALFFSSSEKGGIGKTNNNFFYNFVVFLPLPFLRLFDLLWLCIFLYKLLHFLLFSFFGGSFCCSYLRYLCFCLLIIVVVILVAEKRPCNKRRISSRYGEKRKKYPKSKSSPHFLCQVIIVVFLYHKLYMPYIFVSFLLANDFPPIISQFFVSKMQIYYICDFFSQFVINAHTHMHTYIRLFLAQ